MKPNDLKASLAVMNSALDAKVKNTNTNQELFLNDRMQHLVSLLSAFVLKQHKNIKHVRRPNFARLLC